MANDITIINDGDGLAVLGDSHDIELFLDANNLVSRELGLERFRPIVANAGIALQVSSEVAATAGRWVKLTEKSAAILKQGQAMAGSAGKNSEITRAVVTQNGKIKHILEFSAKGIANPAVLAGVGGLMAQMAMQQALDEITDYLARIEGKVEDVLRAQKDKVFSELIGVGLIIDEALVARAEVGRVSETTWSKIQGSATAIASTQAYAIRQLDSIAEKLERAKADKDLKGAASQAEREVPEWLAVIARCFQLDNAMGILELDRVIDASPHELDDHRRALQINRTKRIEMVANQSERILSRLAEASETAFKGVLLHPLNARAIHASVKTASKSAVDFAVQLGIPAESPQLESRAWRDAAIEKRDDLIEGGAEVVDTVRDFGEKQWSNAVTTAERVIDEVDGKIKKRTRTKPKAGVPKKRNKS